MKNQTAQVFGEFTTAKGKTQQCLLLGESKRGLLKVRYTKRGSEFVAYITPQEFRRS
jgi:hypothetical protein